MMNREIPADPATEEQMEAIHRQAMRLLAEPGWRVEDPTAVDALCRAGCSMSDSGRVRFAPEVTAQALAAAVLEELEA